MRLALTIAGSDAGGGAGIQADLKTFHAFGVFGTSALSLVTAQNTLGVQGVHLLPAEVLTQQIDSVVGDLRPHATKTGALGERGLIEAAAERLARYELMPLVVDPVMISKHGNLLLEEDAVQALVTKLLPLATVVTPNLHEAGALAGGEVRTPAQMGEAARAIGERGPKAVLIKGGAGVEGAEAVDVLWDGERLHSFGVPRIDSTSTHGTGCTFSAAITAGLARGDGLTEAIERAKGYITTAIKRAPGIGGGTGPVDHWAEVSASRKGR